MKTIDHTAAQEFYKKFGTAIMCTTIVQLMYNYGTLWGFVTDITRKVIQQDPDKTKESLEPKLIALAETIDKGFHDPKVKERLKQDIHFKDKTENELFEAVLSNIDYGLRKESEFSDIAEEVWQKIIGDIYDLYGV